MLLSSQGTRNSGPLSGESYSWKCRHPSATKLKGFISAFQEPANIPCITAGLNFYLFLFLAPKLVPVPVFGNWAELGTAGNTWRQRWAMQREKWEGKRGEAVGCLGLLHHDSLQAPSSALLAKEGCDNPVNYWPLVDRCLHVDCDNFWGYIKLITCNRFSCCTGNMPSAYLWKQSSFPCPTLLFILKT